MFLTKFFPKNRVIFWKSVNSCMFLTLSVWVRNIQEFTDNLVTLQLGQFETKSIPVHFCKILEFAETYRNSLLFNFSTILKISEFLYVSWLYTEGKKHTGTDWFCENQWIPVWLLHIAKNGYHFEIGGMYFFSLLRQPASSQPFSCS